ncbi:MAG: 16S rRNA (cytidine(1402)-2'-O)-methyltransferase [Alphaproteobacteria bacterium]|nr:16S rRNA (cytidine(1402)-2'-O)-methyltransferase [Alphaproteobacteria bacterium]
MTSGLYIVATPIGNLSDISERAKTLLSDADVIACEDTRVTKKLLGLLNIGFSGKKFITLHDHNEQEKSQEVIDLVNQGLCVVQVSDAGSPLISDPGYKLIKQCHEQNTPFAVVPGCCAIICALQMSGLPTNRFMFAGFIPNKDKAREDLFEELAGIDTTLVFYETAPRLLKTLGVAKKIFANRDFAVAREITKIHEECKTGTADDVIAYFEKNPPKGEIVFMVAPPTENLAPTVDVEKILRSKMKNMLLKTAVKEVVTEYKLNKNDVYKLAVKIKNEQQS